MGGAAGEMRSKAKLSLSWGSGGAWKYPPATAQDKDDCLHHFWGGYTNLTTADVYIISHFQELGIISKMISPRMTFDKQ